MSGADIYCYKSQCKDCAIEQDSERYIPDTDTPLSHAQLTRVSETGSGALSRPAFRMTFRFRVRFRIRVRFVLNMAS